MSDDDPMSDKPVPPIVDGASITAISIRKNISLEEWRDQFLELAQGTRKILWYLGDLAAFGLSRWPQAVKEFIDSSEFEKTTIQTAAWVCRSIEPSRRRDDISFSTHIEVAALSPDRQNFWLNHYAEKKKQGPYSISQFRAEIRQQLADPTLRQTSAPNRSVIRGIRDFVTFAKQQSSDFWTPEMKASYRTELQPLVEFYNSL